MQHVLDRGGPGIFTAQHCRMVRIRLERSAMGLLAAGTVKARDGASAVRTLHPAVLGTELEFCELRLAGNCTDRGKQLGGIHTVARHGRRLLALRGLGNGVRHGVSPLLSWPERSPGPWTRAMPDVCFALISARRKEGISCFCNSVA